MSTVPFVLPLSVCQRATDTPDNPGSELSATVADAKGHRWFHIHNGASAALDNQRADFIVTACNAHADLVTALRGTVEALENIVDCRDGHYRLHYAEGNADVSDEVGESVNIARAALAKAKAKAGV